jgi:acyl-CoA reductase-like NAD-dependent aldehyde dehydrogenase
VAGNAGVLKPDLQAGFTALWALQLLHECGLPADVLSVVTGEGTRIGPALTRQVAYVMFTGSGETGKAVGQQAAQRLIGCSLELGGKNPMLVPADARLDDAVEGAVRACFKQGQKAPNLHIEVRVRATGGDALDPVTHSIDSTFRNRRFEMISA